MSSQLAARPGGVAADGVAGGTAAGGAAATTQFLRQLHWLLRLSTFFRFGECPLGGWRKRPARLNR